MTVRLTRAEIVALRGLAKRDQVLARRALAAYYTGLRERHRRRRRSLLRAARRIADEAFLAQRGRGGRRGARRR